MSVVRPKLKQLQWPITTNENDATNQWELEANVGHWHQARENTDDKVTSGFDFSSDWLSGWHEIFNETNHRAHQAKRNQKTPDYIGHRNRKPPKRAWSVFVCFLFRVRLIASVPGRHTGLNKTKWGHLKLRKVTNHVDLCFVWQSPPPAV